MGLRGMQKGTCSHANTPAMVSAQPAAPFCPALPARLIAEEKTARITCGLGSGAAPLFSTIYAADR